MLWPDKMEAPFAEGTFDRIESVLDTLEDGSKEDRTAFVREAVEREIKRRQKGRKK